MTDDAKGPTFADAAFLEGVASALDRVKVKPKGVTASQISAAQQANRDFQDRIQKIREIARRIRVAAAATPL